MKKVIAIGIILILSGISVTPSITDQTLAKQNITGGMRIDFFESNPTDENLSKASLIDFSSTIYLRSSSLEEFKLLEEKLHEINPDLEVAYFPFLEKTRFISPFSYTCELENLIQDLQKNKQNKTLKVLLNLELPTDKRLCVKNLFSFHKNKKLIEQIFERAEEFNITIVTAETTKPIWFNTLFGISYPLDKYPHEKIVMFFSSAYLVNFMRIIAKMRTIHKIKVYEPDLQICAGIIGRPDAPGAENYPLITAENLDKDLSFLEKNGIKTAVIYKLGGLNESYLTVIKKHL
jgi:hypothetical protein